MYVYLYLQMPQHIRIAQKLAEVRVLIREVEMELENPDTGRQQRDDWLDRLLDLNDMYEELVKMYRGWYNHTANTRHPPPTPKI